MPADVVSALPALADSMVVCFATLDTEEQSTRIAEFP